MNQKSEAKFHITKRFFIPFFIALLLFIIFASIVSVTSLNKVHNKHIDSFSFYKSNHLIELFKENKKVFNEYKDIILNSHEIQNNFFLATDHLIKISQPLINNLKFFKKTMSIDSIIAIDSENKVIANIGKAIDVGSIPSGSTDYATIKINGKLNFALITSFVIKSYGQVIGKIILLKIFNLDFFNKMSHLTKDDYFILDKNKDIIVNTNISINGNNLLNSIDKLIHAKGYDYIVKSIDITDYNNKVVSTIGIISDISIIQNERNNIIKKFFCFFIILLFVVLFIFKIYAEQLSLRLNNLFDQVSSYKIEIENEKNLAEMGRLMSQVAHDLRSPVSAQDMLLNEISVLPEEIRIIFRSSINRIKDIANTLLNESHSKHQSDSLKTVMLFPLVESIISEKRIQIKGKRDIHFNLIVDKSQYSIFINFNPSDFKRILSNLLNNAMEAINKDGIIDLTISKNNEEINISISDNGRGIPKDIINKIGKEGFSYGKHKGHGIGLSYSIDKLREYHGNLTISSKEGIGTLVKITIPSSIPPSWYTDKVDIPSNLIIIDDDYSIHLVWAKKIEKISHIFNINIINFNSGSEFLNTWKSESLLQYTHNNDYLILLDYEFINESINGTDILSEIQQYKNSILITSRYEESNVIDFCINNGVKIIPKSIMAFIECSYKNL